MLGARTSQTFRATHIFVADVMDKGWTLINVRCICVQRESTNERNRSKSREKKKKKKKKKKKEKKEKKRRKRKRKRKRGQHETKLENVSKGWTSNKRSLDGTEQNNKIIAENVHPLQVSRYFLLTVSQP